MTDDEAPAPPRRILLADCDAMFVSVCRLEDPEGAGRADLLIVGGSPEGRGVVASASYGCRAFGVRSAMPTRRALELCPGALVVPVPRQAVSRMSRHIRSILAEIAVVLEPASVDEFYLDLTGTERVLGDDLALVAADIRARVLEETGISLSIGCATNKLVAKMATTLAKPGGVHAVSAGDEATFMARFELTDIPGIGPRSGERLARLGLRTVLDAQRHTREALIAIAGEKEGGRIFRQSRGIDDRPVEERGASQSRSREDTFAEDLHDAAAIERELLSLVVRCAADLRDDGRLVRTITVKLRDSDFRTRQASRTVPHPLESERRIFQEALLLLRRLREARSGGIRLIGVTLSSFEEPATAGDGFQLGLFPDEAGAAGSRGAEPEGVGQAETDRDRELTRALNALRIRYGDGSILPGTLIDPVDPE